jgi:hypothetical protein
MTRERSLPGGQKHAGFEPLDGMTIIGEPLAAEEDVPLAVLTADTQAAIDQLRADARAAAEASRAPSSERAYAAEWRDFSAFAYRIGRKQMPAEAETVALYVADLKRRGRRPATIARKLAAIAVYHRSLDHPSPTDHDVVRAVVRGTLPPTRRSPAAEGRARARRARGRRGMGLTSFRS